MMGKGLLVALLTVLLVLASGATVLAQPVPTDKEALKALAAARAATAKYHDVANALADDYFPFPPGECVANPLGPGAMGIHYVNFGLASDLVVDELTPEVLLYIPTEAGVRLVAVEYFVAALGSVPPATPGPRWDESAPPLGWVWVPSPTPFGQPMDGPMAPHVPGLMPWHYDLHVWLWQANPAGIFAEFNPNLSCP